MGVKFIHKQKCKNDIVEKGASNLEQAEFDKRISEIMSALSAAGYDPCAQLTGYLQTGDETYITRKGNARELIRTLDKEMIARYIEEHT